MKDLIPRDPGELLLVKVDKNGSARPTLTLYKTALYVQWY